MRYFNIINRDIDVISPCLCLKGDEKNGSSGKSVAIVLGGAATLGLGFIFILLIFRKTCGKKDDD